MTPYVAPAPTFQEALLEVGGERFAQLLQQGVGDTSTDYVHWDKLRHLSPPGDATNLEWWMMIKLARSSMLRAIPLTDSEGNHFTYAIPDRVMLHLHHIDQRCSGEVAMPELVTGDEQARRHYLVNSLMEEAIRSSQLEGATTTRRVAKEMLRTGRAPRDRSELMIVNNYRALQYMRDDIGDELTPNAVVELQRILTDGTLDNPDAAGCLQRPDEVRVSVVDGIDGSVVHDPPPADQLPARLQAMCDFANEDEKERFIHPVVRGILLHFWLAYDHPFEDGNGRTARALFYWYMRRQKYWLVEYLSISEILRSAASKYGRAFILTETDERDATYFLVYQLEVIERAIERLHTVLKKKIKDLREVEQLLKGSGQFNHRQLALLGSALRNPDTSYSFGSHATSHDVTHETARNDVLPLVESGFLERRRSGRGYLFTPYADLASRLKAAH